MMPDQKILSPAFSVRASTALWWNRLYQSRTGWALADQSVLSAGNFLCNLLLARVLPWGEYGVFAFVLIVFQLLNNFLGALVGFQLAYRGATAGEGELRRLFGGSFLLTLLLQPIGIVVLCLSLLSVRHAGTIPVAICALMAWQLQEIARRAMLAKLRFRAAILGDSVSYLGQVVVMWWLYRTGHLTLETTFLASTFTSCLALIIQMLQVGISRIQLSDVRDALKHGWRLGHWLLLATTVSVLVIPIIPWALAYFHSSHEVARYQALATVLGISHPVIFSISNLIGPSTITAYRTGGLIQAERVSRRYSLQGMALLVPYFLILMVIPEVILRLLYGSDSPYANLGPELRLFVVFYVLLYFMQVLVARMNGLGNTSSSFVSQGAAALATVAITVPLCAYGGLYGASWGRLAQGAAGVCAAMWMWKIVKRAKAREVLS